MRAISEKANELSHYGILGMKWGVRRNNRHIGITPSRQKAFDERDA